jgi:hypothetical protein
MPPGPTHNSAFMDLLTAIVFVRLPSQSVFIDIFILECCQVFISCASSRVKKISVPRFKKACSPVLTFHMYKTRSPLRVV